MNRIEYFRKLYNDNESIKVRLKIDDSLSIIDLSNGQKVTCLIKGIKQFGPNHYLIELDNDLEITMKNSIVANFSYVIREIHNHRLLITYLGLGLLKFLIDSHYETDETRFKLLGFLMD